MGIAAVSCEKDTPQTPTKAKVTSVKYYPEDKMTAYNIEYPSTDPYDMPATYREMTQTNLYNYLVNTLGLSPNDITETSSQ